VFDANRNWCASGNVAHKLRNKTRRFICSMNFSENNDSRHAIPCGWNGFTIFVGRVFLIVEKQ